MSRRGGAWITVQHKKNTHPTICDSMPRHSSPFVHCLYSCIVGFSCAVYFTYSIQANIIHQLPQADRHTIWRNWYESPSQDHGCLIVSYKVAQSKIGRVSKSPTQSSPSGICVTKKSHQRVIIMKIIPITEIKTPPSDQSRRVFIR